MLFPRHVLCSFFDHLTYAGVAATTSDSHSFVQLQHWCLQSKRMSRPVSIYGINESLSLTDRENFSIFLRYPEIGFENVDNASSAHPSSAHPSSILTPDNKNQSKSPPSYAGTTGYHSKFSIATESIAHDTPGRHHHCRSGEHGGWNEFIYLMQKSNLPQECLQYFTNLGQTILDLGTILYSPLRPNQHAGALRIGRWLLKSIKYSSKQVNKQVEAAHNLKSTVAFNVQPDESQLWSVYQQRARMIAEYEIHVFGRVDSKADHIFRHTSIPSKREFDVLRSLVFLYDAYVYHQFMKDYLHNPFDKATTDMLNSLYFALMEWWHQYRMWCRSMTNLQTQYLQPLIEQASRSEIAMTELAEIKTNVAIGQTALILSSVNDPKEKEQLMKNLNLSARRPAAETVARRSRTRYRREHTL